MEREGHSPIVLDCPAVGIDRPALELLVKTVQPEFVFWNTATPTLDHDLNISGLIKNAAPRALTGVMGTHVSAIPETALALPMIDVVIRREPEATIRELCLHVNPELAGIKGISFRKPGENSNRHNEDRAFLAPEEIPSPAWKHLDITPYCLPLKGRPFLIVAPVRGCPFPCTFCTAPLYYGKRLRKRPVRNVVDEIQDNSEIFKVRDFFVWADTFTADKDYVKEFSREIAARGLKIYWTCNSRVDTVDMEMLHLMKEAGLWMISFGLESGNNEILKSAGKNITVEQSREAVSMAYQLGIKTSGHFIFGLPGETERTMDQTLALALDLPLDIAQFYCAAPFPGTGLYDQALRKGWLRKVSNVSQRHAVMDLPGLPARRVDEFRRYAYKKFYMRSGTLLHLVSMVESGAIKNILKNMAHFFQWVKS